MTNSTQQFLDKMLIDWNKSSELNGCNIDELKEYLVKHPKSRKRIITVCDNCGSERDVAFQSYRNLCHKCSHNTPTHKKTMSEILTKRYTNQSERDDQSRRAIKRYTNKSERDAQSIRMTESNAIKVNIDKMSGGNDIIKHHYIYDHSDLSLNVVQMTRSDHMKLHGLLRRLGYIIPHIDR